MTPDRAELEATVRRLAAIDRPSASPGEREAAEWIAARLREQGADARVEEERAHGTYWWPGLGLGAIATAAGVAGLRGRRLLGAGAGAFAAAGMYAEVSGGTQWFRRVLPTRSTWNVVAEAGDRAAARTIVFVAHHDAAHGGLMFDDRPIRWAGDRFPELFDGTDQWPPVAALPFAAAGLVAAGSAAGVGGLIAAGLTATAVTMASFVDIARSDVVPGANDNATAVAVVVALAGILGEQPVEGVRVLLVSTGSEESHMEGMRAFAHRHFPSLPREQTTFVCVECVGSEQELVLVEGEGMIRMRQYPDAVKGLLLDAARRVGVRLRRGLKVRFSTDGLIALRAGYPCAAIGAIDRYKLPSNYHKPTDTPENVNYDNVLDCVKVCDAVIRELAA